MWIKLDQSLLEWRWFKNPTVLTVWMYLLLKANYKDGKIGTETIKRGEVFITQERMAEDLGLTRKQVRTALDHLKETGEIRAKRKIGKSVVISIPKYNQYQGEGPIKGQKRANEGPHLQKEQSIENLSPPYNPPKPYHIPTLEEVREYERISSKGKDPDSFFKHYSDLNWNARGQRIYDWQKLYDRWESPEPIPEHPKVQRISTFTDDDGYTYTIIDGKYTVTGRPN